ncbi:MAG: phage portal protein, partial [Propionivibrio sp.]|nr:phage portal protein [Propionivibrio sp.]
LGSAHGTIVLDSGAKFHQLTIPPVDAQFLESRAFQVSEVARIFGVPPHMLMDTEKSTSWGTGIEQQSIGWVVYTLRPWLTRLEQRITKLVRPSKLYVKFRVEGLLRGDSAQRAAFYRAMWSLGALSTNEIRALEDMDPVEGGDVRYRPLNMGVLGTADSANVPDPPHPPRPRRRPVPSSLYRFRGSELPEAWRPGVCPGPSANGGLGHASDLRPDRLVGRRLGRVR